MSVTNRVADATKIYLMPTLVDTVVKQTEINSMLLKGAKPWAGAQMEIPIKWQANENNGSFSGFDTLATAAVDNTVKMTFDAKYSYQSIVLPITDISLNNTAEKVADLMERQVASDAIDLGTKIATQLYSDGTGNGSKDFTGLAAAIDDGTSVSTYGNLSRATYDSIDATVTASGGVLTLAKMYTLHDTVSEGKQTPSVVLTTKAIRSLYEQLLLPALRYTDSSIMSVGASKLAFRDAKVVADSACTTGVMFMINESTMQFYAIKNWEGGTPIKFAPEELDGLPTPGVVTGLGFHETTWTRPTNQMVLNKFVVVGGNLICKNTRFNGKLTGITSI